jgi:hypothetical protein
MHHVMLDSTDSEKTIMFSNSTKDRQYTLIEAIEESIAETDVSAVEMLLKLVSSLLEELPPHKQLSILNLVSYDGWHIE